MKEVAILGIGRTKWGKYPDKTWDDLAEEAIRKALADANVDWKDIQMIFGGSEPYSGKYGLAAGSTMHIRMGTHGIPAVNSYNACATGGYALKNAQVYIASGFCDLVLCFASGISPKGFFVPSQIREFDQTDLDTQRFRVLGQTNPTNFAFKAMRRMHLYGMTEDDLAEIKVKNSRHGASNPYARYQKVYTKEEVLSSAYVAYPLRLFEVCATSDGAAAMVLCSLEKAKQFTTKPVRLLSVGVANPDYNDPIASHGGFAHNLGNFQGDVVESRTAKVAYKEAGVGPEDLSFAEVYDLTSNLELDFYEYIGICKPGEAEKLLHDGVTTIDGRMPINPSGGCGASGESSPAQALYQACELVTQMRGQGGPSQVKGAKLGLGIQRGLLDNSSCIIIKK